jgi:hypothetical protein
MYTSRNADLENVRRYRAIASLYRQTAAFRPLQRCSLLGQAKEWENRALRELESYFMAGTLDPDKQPQVAPSANSRWEKKGRPSTIRARPNERGPLRHAVILIEPATRSSAFA